MGLEKRKNYKKMRIKRRGKLIKGKATKEPPMSVFVLKLMQGMQLKTTCQN